MKSSSLCNVIAIVFIVCGLALLITWDNRTREEVGSMVECTVLWNIECPECGCILCNGGHGEYYCDGKKLEGGEAKDCPRQGIRMKVDRIDTNARVFLKVVKDQDPK